MKLLNKKSLFILFSVFSIIGYSFVVFAAAPNGGYTPGTTLDPDCAPGDTDCIVAVATGGSSQWDDVVGGINYAGGNVGIGTTTPSAALDVVGTIQGSNLNITGDGITTAAPTNISASFIYDNSYNYSAYSYPHNYRVYSYKDTVQGRVYSPSYLTLASPSDPAPTAPTNLVASQTCTDGCNYYADGSVSQNFRVYAYKIVNDQRIYSTSYATLVSNFTDDNSNSNYDVTLSWDPVVDADGYRVLKYDQNYNNFNYDAGYDTATTSIIDDGCGNLCYDSGKSSATTTNDIFDDNSTNQYGIELSWDPVVDADGYRVLIYDPNYNGYNYDAGYDTTSTSFIDDACGSICFDSGLSNVGQTSVYTNVATINGQLTLTGPIIIQGNSLAGYSNGSISFGTTASTAGYSNSIAFGTNATNTSSNQFALSDSISMIRLNGVEYVLPSAATSSNQVLTNDGSGGLSWADSISSVRYINNSYVGQTSGPGGNGTSGAGGTNVFLGDNAGDGATNANYSNFIGFNTGYNATNASYSNFLGNQAGLNATNAQHSNFFGVGAGTAATGANNSNFFGQSAGNGATDATQSNFFGLNAGTNATTAGSANFFGTNAGQNATNASHSNFLGSNAGYGATAAQYSNFIGLNAGQSAISAAYSNFFGENTGFNATNASYSNFFGPGAGTGATNASYSNFFGYQAGSFATNATESVFIGRDAGRYTPGTKGSQNAAHSIFIGKSAGYFPADVTLNNTGNADDFSILIGNSTSTGGYSNSIALGHSATNTASNQFMIGSTTRPIDTTRINGSASTQCTITTGVGIACTSDERLKTNITDLTTDTLDKVLNLKTVTYNWLENPDSPTQIGFLAQDLEQYFPELVATDSVGYKSVYYSQITPVLVEAIREMNLKITDINNTEIPNTWRDALIAWFGNVGNGITELFVGRVRTHELCLDDICVTKDQLQQLLQNTPQVITPPSSPDPIPDPDPVITLDNTTPPPSETDPVIDSTDIGNIISPDTTTGDTPTE